MLQLKFKYSRDSLVSSRIRRHWGSDYRFHRLVSLLYTARSQFVECDSIMVANSGIDSPLRLAIPAFIT